MPKRKREDDEEERIDRIEDRAVRIKASRLKAKVNQGHKILKNAIQLARGFERQKLGRRQKQAEKDPHNLLRLREEVIILKEFDPSRVAKEYLFKQFVKTKRIKESPAFIALHGDAAKVEGRRSAAESNVLGRIFKSNPVKEVLPEIMQGVRDVLGLDGSRNLATGVGTKPTSDTQQLDSPLNGMEEDLSGSADEQSGSELQSNRQKLLAGLSLDSSSDGDGEDDAAAAHGPPVRTSPSRRQSISSAADSLMQSDDEDSEGPDRLSVSNHPKSTTRQAALPAGKLSTTAFLPSLSMGGYYSGSETASDIDDDLDRRRGPAVPQPRKNRRGQRERQKIAAMKYGSSANHLTKQGENAAKSSGGRDVGWDAKRGAVGTAKARKFERNGRLGGKARFAKGPTGANGDVVNTTRAQERKSGSKKADGPLHPSWEAARKKKIEGSNATFTGRKITFD